MSEDIELIDYRDYIPDMKRISHAVSYLEHVPDELDVRHDVNSQGKKKTVENLRSQIRERKSVMAGLHTEIVELSYLVKRVEEGEFSGS